MMRTLPDNRYWLPIVLVVVALLVIVLTSVR